MSTVQVLSIQVFQSIWSDPSLSRGFYLLETIKLGKYFNQSTNKNCTVFLPWFGMFNIVKTPFIFSLSVNFISYVNNFSSQLFYLYSTHVYVFFYIYVCFSKVKHFDLTYLFKVCPMQNWRDWIVGLYLYQDQPA